MMEISKGLRKEIMLVQNKLKNAIRDHQICMGKLKDNSNNADILGQIEEIRLHIISLGRCQKQVVQRLRKEVEAFKAENVNGAKLSIASLLGLNNNNNSNHNNNNNSNANKNNNANSNKSKNNEHVAVDENDEQEDIVQVKVKQNGVVDNRRLCKENYEEVVRNGIDASSQEKICAKERSRSVEVLPTEADVIEVSDDENTCENSDSVGRLEEIEETSSSEQSELNSKQVIFLGNLALITASKFSELQHKRAERKRRSTANPQFVYSNWDIPTKRKRHAYLQSVGNAPQTRQTTARLNGPSPPPSKISSSKSTSPSTKSSKSLMLIQKSTSVRPNILRNISESIELSNKTQLENGISDMPIPDSKSLQVKTMHIPGLPSCLTIERIESDTAVCVYCRNPGTLTYCDDCPVSYHASCRSSSPPPVRLCSKCVQNQKDDDRTQTPVIKKDEEIEEKERERYEQRERNSDLRLQVYELEKRSQLLGQSFQLQHHLRQELLTKQEKTQKSIKRLVDFIKLIQLRPANSSPPTTMASTSSQSPPTSSPFHPVTSPIQRSITQQISSPIPPMTPTSPTQLTLNTSTTRALTISPVHHSSSINSTTIAVSCHSPTFKQRKSNSNHFLSSKKYPIHPSEESSVTNSSIPINIPNSIITHTVNCKTQQLITNYQSSNHEKDKMILSVPRPMSTISSPVVAPSQPFETKKSPPPARYPDSSPLQARKNPPSIKLMTASTDVPWNYQHQQQQRCEMNVTSPKSLVPLDTNQLTSQTVNAVNLKNQKPINWGQTPISINQTITQNPGIYSTHCSQAITSPITSPIVMINPREKNSIIFHQDQSQIDSIDDSLKINRVCEEQENPLQNSTNT